MHYVSTLTLGYVNPDINYKSIELEKNCLTIINFNQISLLKE